MGIRHNALKQAKNIGPPDRYAAGTFIYSAGSLPGVPYSADYAALTAGVVNFPTATNKNTHYGSIAVIDNGAFPVVVEPSGSRAILEAAGSYNGDPNGGRCVVFGNTQWGENENDARETLFENAILWASRKTNPGSITIGLGTNLDAGYFLNQGFQVVSVSRSTSVNTNGLPPCDVIVLEWRATGFSDADVQQLMAFAAQGGGVVITFTPWLYVHNQIRPPFTRANTFLSPFGLEYRPSLGQPADHGFTNIQSVPYPITFSAFPAAQLLYQDRQGQVQLDNLEKAIALNTITYTVSGRPDLLLALTAAYSGMTNTVAATGESNFVDAVFMYGAQAATNWLGQWRVDGNDLVAQSRRGLVEYDFSVPASDLYRLEIDGAQDKPNCSITNFDLILTLDGVSLGHCPLNAPAGAIGSSYAFTPYIQAGSHTLRILWDNPVTYTSLRLKAMHVQVGLGADSNGDGIKDWVGALVNSQSGMDATNSTLSSYISPMCLEGRDPYLSLVQMSVEGAYNQMPTVTPQPGPNRRWYVNVPLASGAASVFQISYQNGVKTETKNLQWLPANVLDGGQFTVRKGDSLQLLASPDSGANSKAQMVLTIGTNQVTRNVTQTYAYQFRKAGVFTVSGTYLPPKNGPTQSGSITVQVVDESITNNPDCQVGQERIWNVTVVPPTAVLATDARVFYESIAPLPGGGIETGLIVDQNEPRYLLSRLGTNGPVLASAQANGFQLWSGSGTYTKVLQTYADGSQLLESMVIMSPVLPDLTVRLDVIAGGVTFDDGTTSKTLTATDFDALGCCLVHYNRPAASKTSVCTAVSIFQGSTLIQYTR